jgi:hypothetical protein
VTRGGMAGTDAVGAGAGDAGVTIERVAGRAAIGPALATDAGAAVAAATGSGAGAGAGAGAGTGDVTGGVGVS